MGGPTADPSALGLGRQEERGRRDAEADRRVSGGGGGSLVVVGWRGKGRGAKRLEHRISAFHGSRGVAIDVAPQALGVELGGIGVPKEVPEPEELLPVLLCLSWEERGPHPGDRRSGVRPRAATEMPARAGSLGERQGALEPEQDLLEPLASVVESQRDERTSGSPAAGSTERARSSCRKTQAQSR